MTFNIECYECKCSFNFCSYDSKNFLDNNLKCKNCIKKICCCIVIHINKQVKNPTHLTSSFKSIKSFFSFAKKVYPTIMGIEILCIMAAETGENIALYGFGFNLQGIIIAYILGYIFAGFTTFMTIIGRYSYNDLKIESCCSILEQQPNANFISSMLLTFKNFINGIKKIPDLRKQPNMKYLLKTSLVILITGESACILTAETVGIIFYNYSILLSFPLALLIGSFTVVIILGYTKLKSKSRCDDNCSC
ncbi:MAG: hypothetical protein ACPKPY_05615 [Nitrososphaeraceae archaeon]